ncbi:hypothetical protein QBC34DRAFT_411995 [Podospora aff. communis PSN243]|uniref:Uncharacterized protein n=1 Tax=Podospora aff. communis PSN243 TaxID=3040156 RepID=A0AAV9GCD1_9PEZI|nr:hypothetical protein QBC34DRAFT_411995 [Podospora aff. communis PSN243]
MASSGPSARHPFIFDSPGHGHYAGNNSEADGGYFAPLTAAEEEEITFAAIDPPYTGKGKAVESFPQRVSLNGPLPRFQVDDEQPFKPLEPAGGLPTFRPETIMRTLKLEGHYLDVVGLLYPQATFCVTLWPPSENTTVRLTGFALAKLGVLLSPDARDELYIVDLRIRDWPSGGVARIPDTPEARAVIEELQGGFDTISESETWLFCGYDRVDDNGQVDHIIKVLRGYEGIDGPRSDAVIKNWLDTHSGYVEDDGNGREIAQIMEYNYDVADNSDAAPKRKKKEMVAPKRTHRASDRYRGSDDNGPHEDPTMEPDLPVEATPRRRSAKKVRVKKEKVHGGAPSSGRRRGAKRKRVDDSEDGSDGDYVNYYALSRGESRSSPLSKSGSKRTPRSARLKAQEALRAEAEADAVADMGMDEDTDDLFGHADVKAEPKPDWREY